jgi:hypothetical protein
VLGCQGRADVNLPCCSNMLPLPTLLVCLQINERNIMWNDELKLRLIKVGRAAAAAASSNLTQHLPPALQSTVLKVSYSAHTCLVQATSVPIDPHIWPGCERHARRAM